MAFMEVTRRRRSMRRRDPALYLDVSTHSDRLIAIIAVKRGCRCDNCIRIRREEATRYRKSKPPQATVEQRLKWNLKRKYGLTLDAYRTMVDEQDGACVICRFVPPPASRLHVDHDHSTGRVRGLLCQPCNTYLGRIKDSPAAARRLLAYLGAPD